MNFYKTTNYLKSEIAKKEAEIKQLKKEIFDAQVREFYWHINERVRVMDEDFYDTEIEIAYHQWLHHDSGHGFGCLQNIGIRIAVFLE